MMRLTVRENAAVAALDQLPPRLAAEPRRASAPGSASALRSLDVRAPSLDAEVSALSGGNQQKVVIARALLSDAAAGHRRRADPGRRRRRPRRDLPDPARGRRRRRPGHRELVRCQGARGPVRRGLVMSRGQVDRDPDRRRRHRGADRSPPRSARRPGRPSDGRAARAPRTPQPRAALAPGRLRALAAAPRSYVALAATSSRSNERYLSAFNLTTVLPPPPRSASSRSARPSPADRRHRPVGRPAGRLPGRGRVVLHQRRQARRR